MKALLTAMAVVLVASVVQAEDSLILWMFDEDTSIREVNGVSAATTVDQLVGRGDAEGLTVNSLRIRMTDSAGNTEYLLLGDLHQGADGVSGEVSWFGTVAALGNVVDGQTGESYELWSLGPYVAKASSFDLGKEDSTVTFAIELGNYTSEAEWYVLAVSESTTLSNLHNSIIDGAQYAHGGVEWTGARYAVPEPGSALLLLVGGGLLALRRRRRRA